MRQAVAVIAALAMCLFAQTPSAAQVDPRAPLHQLISAFQNCGPPQAYQILSPQLFQAIAMQTGGSGCYQQIAMAGPVMNMQTLDQRQFPNGTMYVVRVQHAQFAVDWFIGINHYGQVDYLNYQNAATGGPAPTIATGPGPTSTGPSPTAPAPTRPSGGTQDGCTLYPSMC